MCATWRSIRKRAGSPCFATPPSRTWAGPSTRATSKGSSRAARRRESAGALNEEYVYSEAGTLENPGFLDYRVPVASDLPMIDTVLVEVPNPRHPYGVRGVGEVPIVPPLAAVANAIYHACGTRMNHLPASPPRLLAALDAAKLPEAAD